LKKRGDCEFLCVKVCVRARIVDQSREAQLRVTRECPSSSAFASINNDQPENALLVDIFGKKTVRDDEEFQRRKLNNYNRELHPVAVGCCYLTKFSRPILCLSYYVHTIET
jgi:hypothetical protein